MWSSWCHQVDCEVTGMRISTSKPDTMVPIWKMVDCPLQVGSEVMPQVFKYLRVLFTSEGRMEINRQNSYTDFSHSNSVLVGCDEGAEPAGKTPFTGRFMKSQTDATEVSFLRRVRILDI